MLLTSLYSTLISTLQMMLTIFGFRVIGLMQTAISDYIVAEAFMAVRAI